MLNGSVVIVTGAGSGIGRAAATILAREGAHVLVADMDEGAARATLAMVEGQGGTGLAVACDITREEEVAAMVAAAVERWGRLDGAFNNAGIAPSETSLVDDSLANWRVILDVDLLGTMLCMKHEITAMLKTGGGAIVNNASNAGKAAVPLLASYAAAKAGVINLSLSGAVAYGAQGIRVNAICPGVILTEKMKSLLADGAGMAEGLQIPVNRYGAPEEVAELAAWLLSLRASYVTGQAISVDGGQNACQ